MHLKLPVAIVMVACFGIVAVVMLRLPAWRDDLSVEIAKTALQVGVIGILGLFAQAVMEDYKNRQQLSNTKSQLRRDMLVELIAVYNRTKLARRLMRAKVDYGKEARRLNEIQLDIEGLKQRSKLVFDDTNNGRAIYDELDRMEEYLRAVVTEWQAAPNARDANLAKEHHKNFWAKEGTFETFAQAHAKACRLMTSCIAGRTA